MNIMRSLIGPTKYITRECILSHNIKTDAIFNFNMIIPNKNSKNLLDTNIYLKTSNDKKIQLFNEPKIFNGHNPLLLFLCPYSSFSIYSNIEILFQYDSFIFKDEIKKNMYTEEGTLIIDYGFFIAKYEHGSLSFENKDDRNHNNNNILTNIFNIYIPESPRIEMNYDTNRVYDPKIR